MSDRHPARVAAHVVAFPEAAVSLVDAFIRGLPSASTRTAYRRAIDGFAEFLGRDLLTASRRDIEAHRASLEAAGRAPATIAKMMSAVSGFYDFAMADGAVDRNPAASARRPKVADTSPHRALSPADVRAILAVPDVSKLVGLRDRALLVTLVVQGWRVSEALGLRVEDLAEEGGHKVATICGKGGKVARVPLAAATWHAVSAWLQAANATTGPVFVAVTKGGVVVTGEAVSQQAAWKRLQSIAKKAGVARHVHAHLFRHGAVTTALASGVPLHQVQDFARHADPRTTRRYDSHRASLANPAPHVLAAALVD